MRALLERISKPIGPAPLDKADRIRLTSESVGSELERLLNGRSYFDGTGRRSMHKTVLNYGLASVVDTAPGSTAETDRLAREIETAIKAYEPRIKSARATISAVAGGQSEFLVNIEADLALGKERVNFYIPLAIGTN